MKTIYKVLIGLGIVVLAVVFLSNQKVEKTLGSVQDGQGYFSTTTVSLAAGTKAQLKTTGGMLGSLIIASTTAGLNNFILKDATSTTDISSTTLAVFGATPTVGTYTFDVVFTRGLVIEATGAISGSITTTYK